MPRSGVRLTSNLLRRPEGFNEAGAIMPRSGQLLASVGAVRSGLQ